MTRRGRILGFGLAAVAAGLAFASDEEVTFSDVTGDAVLRRTDFGGNDLVSPASTLPDLMELRLAGWSPLDPANDPYTGVVIEGKDAVIFRLQLVFDGLVNPPGTLGTAGEPFEPFAYGPSPLYGFLDLDVDRDKDTGGELGGAATQRYLANVARFGATPKGSIGQRAIRKPEDCDANFDSDPQFEKTGADFAFLLCGCWPVEIEEQFIGNANSVFEAGERWIVSGRFLERAQGYSDIAKSSAIGLPCETGGTGFGFYDPISEALWEHDAALDRTTITFVGALDMPGAALLAGEPTQAWDFNTCNHTSIREGLEDLIFAAGNCPPPNNAVEELIERWEGREAEDYLDPTDWDVTALFGTTYFEQPTDNSGALYAWTDTGFDEIFGDYNGDELVNGLDDIALADACEAGPTPVEEFAVCFSMFDGNYDGVVDEADCPTVCEADMNGDGKLNALDFVAFQGFFIAGDLKADTNGDGMLNVMDFVAFQQLFAQGCA